MQHAVMEHFGTAMPVTYQFNNRRKEDKFTQDFLADLRIQINMMADLQLHDGDLFNFQQACPFLPQKYFDYLQHFRFDPEQVVVWLDEKQDLQLRIEGFWHETILWEVPLMAIISELYFKDKPLSGEQRQRYYRNLEAKYDNLADAGCSFSDFGTRRRRSFDIHQMVVSLFSDMCKKDPERAFTGTSNVMLGLQHKIPIGGTTAHEWTMGHSAFNLKHANKIALEVWADVYRGNLGIALTDTFGTKAFFNDFDGYLARLYDGVRHDSGCPLIFTDSIVDHYKKLGIDPSTKKIVFSDGLNVGECSKIITHVNNRIRCFFGIGTNLTNDVQGSKALNMVIKLRTVNGKEVVKISDNAGKETGDTVALAEAFKIFGFGGLL